MKTAENNNVDGTIEKLLDGLISVIGDEAQVFETFLDLLERQQRALVDNNLDELHMVTSRLQQVVLQSQQLEKFRSDTVEEIRRRGGAETDMTVSQICDMADTGRSGQLRTLRETVLNLYSQIEEMRMRNGLLVRQSMEQIRNTMEMIGRIPAQKEIYQSQGSLSKEFTPVGVDRRI